MSQKGKPQFTVVFTATPDLVEEGDRIFESHASWMAQTHSREGEYALLSYNVVKGPELSNPLDPSSRPTGNTCIVLTEVYESQAGMEAHSRCAAESWKELPAFSEWVSKCKVTALQAAPIIHSLW